MLVFGPVYVVLTSNEMYICLAHFIVLSARLEKRPGAWPSLKACKNDARIIFQWAYMT